MMDASFECELASGVDAPGVARGVLTGWFSFVRADDTLTTTARLLVSELVTNAVAHGRGRITLRARFVKLRVLIEVLDEGGGFEREGRERDSQPAGAGGWGLSIVDAESSRWGVRPDRSHVWFELDRPRPRLAYEGGGLPGVDR